jgi:putative peptidoglycan lipid II flippase
MSEQTRQYQAMAKTASWTLVSRVLGLVRDQLTAAVFGAGAVGAAFLFAFQIPNLFRRLLGEGALTVAVVPVLADKTAREGKASAFSFLNYVLGRILPWMLGLTLAGMGLALAWALLSPDYSRASRAAELTAYCMPYMPLICVAALFTSAVNLSGRFGLAEFASALLNLCMIVALGFFGWAFAETDMGKARWLCAGAIVGGALQLLIPLRGLRQEGWRPGPSVADEAAWRALMLAFVPAALGAGIQQINFLVSRCLAFGVSDASLTYYYVANRIVELPIGLFSASIATVMFPALATAFAERDDAALSRNFARGMRLILAVNVAAAVGLIVLSGPIVQLLFRFGRFEAADCEHTRVILVLFAFAMPFYAMISLVTRALNVAGNTKATFWAAAHAFGVNVAASLIAVWQGWGIEGLAVANGISTIWQYLVLRRMLARSAPAFLGENLWRPAVKVVVGSAGLGYVAYQSYHYLDRWVSPYLPGKAGLFLVMSLAAAVAAALYAWLLCAWNYPERDLVIAYRDKMLRFLRLRR